MALEIKCSDLGHNDCGWKAVSNTEDKLADYVALHMRDQHGIREFTQEMIADVKKLGRVVTPSDKSKDPSMKVYRCSKCDWRYIAQTEDLIADAVAVHERDVHDVKLFTPEMVGKVKNSLNPWS